MMSSRHLTCYEHQREDVMAHSALLHGSILVHSQIRLWFSMGCDLCFMHFPPLCLVTWPYTCVGTRLRIFGFDVSVIISTIVFHSIRILKVTYWCPFFFPFPSAPSKTVDCEESQMSVVLEGRKGPKLGDAADCFSVPVGLICSFAAEICPSSWVILEWSIAAGRSRWPLLILQVS